MYEVIKRPLVTEKNSILSEQGIYAFEVDKKATKVEVKQSVEKLFRVKVSNVRTLICRGRSKKTRLGVSAPRYWKKAFVKLSPGEKIEMFEGA